MSMLNAIQKGHHPRNPRPAPLRPQVGEERFGTTGFACPISHQTHGSCLVTHATGRIVSDMGIVSCLPVSMCPD